MIPKQSGNETNIKLPLSFIIFSLLAFIISQVIILTSGVTIINGVFRTPSIWAAAHLLILGWALMVAMGAMYQLVPVAFLTAIWNERFGFFQFGISALGITSLSISLFYFPDLLLYGGTLTVIGILMFLYQMFMTMKKQTNKNVLTLYIGSALLCLLLTILLGLLLALNLSTGQEIMEHLTILKSHILVGVAGWFTLLIFGFSYKMVPMFSLAHGFSMKLSHWVVSIYLIGLVTTVGSFILQRNYLFQLGLLFLAIAFGLFAYHISLIIKARLKKKLDKPFVFSLMAIGFGFIIHSSAFLLSFFPSYYSFFGILIYLYIFNWIVFSIIGYLYKIVPFLWWTHRYSKLIGKENVPTLKEMMNDNASIPIFSGFLIGSIGILFAYLFNSHILFLISQGIVTSITITYCLMIINVLRK